MSKSRLVTIPTAINIICITILVVILFSACQTTQTKHHSITGHITEETAVQFKQFHDTLLPNDEVILDIRSVGATVIIVSSEDIAR